MHRSVLAYCFSIGILLLLSGCKNKKQEDLPYYNTPDFTPIWTASKVDHRIGSFSFTDQDSQIVNNKTIDKKIHVANFMFTSCVSICPKMAANFQTLQKIFKNNKDVVLLSYSVTPWADSIPRLQKFAKRYGVLSNQWHLLTGSTQAIYDLARKSYFAEEELGFAKDSTEFLHTEHFILVDQRGYIRGIYNGTLALEAERLAADIRILLATSSGPF